MRKTVYCLLAFLLSTNLCSATQAVPPPEFNNKDFRLSLTPLTPNQVIASYSAQGFPAAALAALRKTCIFNLRLHNNSNTTVWFNLGNWRFSTPQGALHRIRRNDWQRRWRILGLTHQFQSLFGKTLAPERLDFRPHESKSGNIVLTHTGQPITITADIYVGKQKNRLYTLSFARLYCAGN